MAENFFFFLVHDIWEHPLAAVSPIQLYFLAFWMVFSKQFNSFPFNYISVYINTIQQTLTFSAENTKVIRDSNHQAFKKSRIVSNFIFYNETTHSTDLSAPAMSGLFVTLNRHFLSFFRMTKDAGQHSVLLKASIKWKKLNFHVLSPNVWFLLKSLLILPNLFILWVNRKLHECVTLYLFFLLISVTWRMYLLFGT